MWLQWLYRWGYTIIIIYLLTFDILMLSRVLIIGQMLICYSTHSLVTAWQMGWGVGRGGKPGRYHWPSSPPHQLHQQHATCIMGPTHPLLWQKLNCPQAPQYNRALSPASCVEQLPPLAPWSLNKFSSSQRDVSCSLGLWLFINNGINNCCWGKKLFWKLWGK